MTVADTVSKVDAFWAGYFGCSPDDLHASKTLVVSHVALKGYDGALVFRRGGASIISVPETTPEIERRKLREARPEQVFDAAFLARTFVVSAEKVTGPAWVGVCDRDDFRPVAGATRLLTDDDGEALARLAEGCGELVWKQSKLVLELKPMFGLFVGNDIAAASGYRVMGTVAYVGVVTHPAHRGKGHAKAVASASMKDAFEKGLVPLWRTTHANASAIGLAQHLGFRHYASTLDVQLVEDEF